MRKVLLLAMGLCLLMSGTSFAFHDAGVAYCGGCHTMHNSNHFGIATQVLDTGDTTLTGDPILDTVNIGGLAADLTTDPAGYDYLLKDATASDVCLGCHAKYGQMLGTPSSPTKITPGGNFIFLLANNLNESSHSSTVIPGDAAGHNLNSPGFGLGPDGSKTEAPGGDFLSTDMGCTACHDPHGNTEYRLLHTSGQTIETVNAGGTFTFTNAAPLAEGPSRTTAESATAHTAFKSGMGAWCANCHGDYHASGDFLHPTDANLGTAIAANYNKYRGTGQPYVADVNTSYLPEVPFENGSFDFSDTTINFLASTVGPSSSSKVFCLSCHRAHASSGPSSGRWDFNVTLLSDDGYRDTPALTNPYPLAGDNQRSLCNKCHLQDEYDHVE